MQAVLLNQPAFGGMLHQLVSLGVLELRLEPLGAHRAATEGCLAVSTVP